MLFNGEEGEAGRVVVKESPQEERGGQGDECLGGGGPSPAGDASCGALTLVPVMDVSGGLPSLPPSSLPVRFSEVPPH